MKTLVLIFFTLILAPSLAFAQPANAEFSMTATDIIAGTALETAATTYTTALADGSYVIIDILNETDCDVEVRFDDLTGAPTTIVPAGTFETLEPGASGGYFGTSISARERTGVTCSSGNLYIKGIK